ncbi:hypothetical protein CSB45_06435 [candidate division KSB3 bacterium]|uniref:Uncharacterized protein n=1 Tax=candidate division KSB3 bacterium TaxID=2044937 RepID=A0A2G6E7J3_9BACT|nr:MAG: hypothetical protein CSB45_06435 [candidate division KSB3 bacterium]PIE30278.1 MAG: hypothetical protein CSA57_05150 [candidate division KSB3 bacterium]
MTFIAVGFMLFCKNVFVQKILHSFHKVSSKICKNAARIYLTRCLDSARISHYAQKDSCADERAFFMSSHFVYHSHRMCGDMKFPQRSAAEKTIISL